MGQAVQGVLFGYLAKTSLESPIKDPRMHLLVTPYVVTPLHHGACGRASKQSRSPQRAGCPTPGKVYGFRV